jgi:hypothetical protein
VVAASQYQKHTSSPQGVYTLLKEIFNGDLGKIGRAKAMHYVYTYS